MRAVFDAITYVGLGFALGLLGRALWILLRMKR